MAHLRCTGSKETTESHHASEALGPRTESIACAELMGSVHGCSLSFLSWLLLSGRVSRTDPQGRDMTVQAVDLQIIDEFDGICIASFCISLLSQQVSSPCLHGRFTVGAPHT